MIHIPVSTSSIFAEPVMSNCFVTASMSLKQTWEIHKFIFFSQKSTYPNRLQNNLYFFKYVQTVKQKVMSEAENGERDLEETHALQAYRRVRRAHFTRLRLSGTVHFLRGRGAGGIFWTPITNYHAPPPTQSSFLLMPPHRRSFLGGDLPFQKRHYDN